MDASARLSKKKIALQKVNFPLLKRGKKDAKAFACLMQACISSPFTRLNLWKIFSLGVLLTGRACPEACVAGLIGEVRVLVLVDRVSALVATCASEKILGIGLVIAAEHLDRSPAPRLDR